MPEKVDNFGKNLISFSDFPSEFSLAHETIPNLNFL